MSWLDRWAAKEQQRVQRRANAPTVVPGEEPRWQRFTVGSIGVFNFFGSGLAYLLMLTWGIVLLVRHTVPSVVLGVVLSVVSVQLLVLRIYVVRVRARNGRSIVTGLARRPPRA